MIRTKPIPKNKANGHASRLGVHFSSETPEWPTPDDLFDELNDIFHFDLDACATPANAKCPRFFTKEQDALTKRWEGTTWMNPPYGREIARFMKKAYEESLAGSTVVCLVPSRTDTHWWHSYAKRGLIIPLRGRLKFGGAKTSAPFPSAIVIFFGGRLGDAVRPVLSDFELYAKPDHSADSRRNHRARPHLIVERNNTASGGGVTTGMPRTARDVEQT